MGIATCGSMSGAADFKNDDDDDAMALRNEYDSSLEVDEDETWDSYEAPPMTTR